MAKGKKSIPPSEQLTGETTFRTNTSDVAARKKAVANSVFNDNSYGYGEKAAVARGAAIKKAEKRVDDSVTDRYLNTKESAGAKTAAGKKAVAARAKNKPMASGPSFSYSLASGTNSIGINSLKPEKKGK